MADIAVRKSVDRVMYSILPWVSILKLLMRRRGNSH